MGRHSKILAVGDTMSDAFLPVFDLHRECWDLLMSTIVQKLMDIHCCVDRIASIDGYRTWTLLIRDIIMFFFFCFTTVDYRVPYICVSHFLLFWKYLNYLFLLVLLFKSCHFQTTINYNFQFQLKKNMCQKEKYTNCIWFDYIMSFTFQLFLWIFKE